LNTVTAIRVAINQRPGKQRTYRDGHKKIPIRLQALYNTIKTKGSVRMSILDNKKVVIIGDRDGVPGQAIEECVKTSSAEVVFSSTECFV
jgi:hypothetical protein